MLCPAEPAATAARSPEKEPEKDEGDDDEGRHVGHVDFPGAVVGKTRIG